MSAPTTRRRHPRWKQRRLHWTITTADSSENSRGWQSNRADQRRTKKLRRAIDIVRGLLQEGFHPILWCRYIAIAEYVAEHLGQQLPDKVQVVCVTGRLGNEERQAKIEEIDSDQPRVLVATDCLSETINLQEKFTAVVHYDLPWNPTASNSEKGKSTATDNQPRPSRRCAFSGATTPWTVS